MSQKELSRRDFLRRSTVLGVVAIGSSSIISACGGGQEQAAPAMSEEPAPMAEPMAEAGCTDVSGLTDAEVQMRQTLQYADVSPKPDQVCSGCQLFVPAEDGGACGGCQIVKGPIAPGGYCTSWAQKVA